MIAPPRPLVIVIDDDPSARASLSDLLRAEGYVVEAFDGTLLFLTRAPEEGACCIVLEVALPDLDGLSLQRQLTASERREEVVFVTGQGTIPSGIQAMKQGAVDFLTKPFEKDALLDAVAEALLRSAGKLKLLGEAAQILARVATLTPREFQVFRLVIAGLLNKQIANELGTALQTIKIHRARVMHKLSVVSVADLVRQADLAAITPASHQQ